MTETDKTPVSRGPASPTASAAVRHRPVEEPGARLTGSLLRDWQRRGIVESKGGWTIILKAEELRRLAAGNSIETGPA